jgi:hypothetical protein
MTSVQEARKKELARSLVENAKQVEANRQRQRRMREEAQRQQEEDDRQRAWEESLHRQAIEERVSKKMEKERLDQEQIENAKKSLADKFRTAAAILQQKRVQYLISHSTAPGELDSQCDNFAKEWMDDFAKIKDPAMRERLLSTAGPVLQFVREKYKKNIEEKLEKQASESGMPYFSPF